MLVRAPSGAAATPGVPGHRAAAARRIALAAAAAGVVAVAPLRAQVVPPPPPPPAAAPAAPASAGAVEAAAIRRVDDAAADTLDAIARRVARLDSAIAGNSSDQALLRDLRSRVQLLEQAAQTRATSEVEAAKQRYLAGADILADMITRLNGLDFATQFSAAYSALGTAGNPYTYAPLRSSVESLTSGLPGNNAVFNEAGVRSSIFGTMNPWINVTYSVVALFLTNNNRDAKRQANAAMLCGFQLTTTLSTEASRFGAELDVIAAETQRLRLDMESLMATYLSVVGFAGGYPEYVRARQAGTPQLLSAVDAYFQPILDRARASASVGATAPERAMLPVNVGALNIRDHLGRYERHLRDVQGLLLRLEQLPRDPRFAAAATCDAVSTMPDQLRRVAQSAASARTLFEAAYLNALPPADRRAVVFGY